MFTRRLSHLLMLGTVLCIIACNGDQKTDGHHSAAKDTQPKDSVQLRFEALSAQIAKDSTDAAAYESRAALQYEEGLLEDALADLQRCVDANDDRLTCYYLMSDVYLDLNNFRLSLQALEDALEQNRDDEETLLKLGRLQIILQRYPAALISLNKVISINPEQEEAYLLRGIAYRDQGNPVKATASLQEAIQINPDLIDAHLILGQLFEAAGNPAALRYYENALRLDPEDKQVMLAVAGYSWTQQNLQVARQQYDAILDAHPDFTEAWYNRGLLRMEQSDYQGAVEDLTQTVQLSPDFIYGNYHLGEALRLNGDLDSSLIYIDRASKLSPNDERIRTALRDLQDQMAQ